MRAVVSSEENHEHFVEDTALLFNFFRKVARNVGNGHPLLFTHVEGVIVLLDGRIMSSIEEDFVAISDEVMKGSARR